MALLGAGCLDKEATIEEAKCEIAPGVEARVLYHQKAAGNDYFGLEIYSHNKDATSQLVTSITMSNCYGERCSIQCQNGGKISWVDINTGVTWK